MNDQMMNEGVWPTWLQQAMWLMEWLQPLLYGLLAIALVSLVLTLLDLAMLCWKELHPAHVQETTNARSAPMNEAKNESEVAMKNQSYYTIKVLLLLLCCCLKKNHPG